MTGSFTNSNYTLEGFDFSLFGGLLVKQTDNVFSLFTEHEIINIPSKDCFSTASHIAPFSDRKNEVAGESYSIVKAWIGVCFQNLEE